VAIRRSMYTMLAALLSLFAVTATAEDAAPAAPAAGATQQPVQLPPWVTPDLIKATQAINLTPEQNPKFQQVVGDYVSAHFAMIAKVNKSAPPNIDMTIRSKDKALVHQMDDEMKGVITDAQWPAFENYKKVLKSGLKP
jgi:hypothetical protein